MENENAMQIVTADKLAATYFNPTKLSEMKNLATAFFKAQCFGQDVKNEFQALAKIQAGYEMGIPPMESMSSLYIVNGKVTIWGMAMTKKLRQAGWKMKYEESEGACKVTITKGEETYDYTATLEEVRKLNSKAIGFAAKDKLRWHAIGRLIRFNVPEVLSGGVNYLTEEVEGNTVVEVVNGSAEDRLLTVDEFIAKIEAANSPEEVNQLTASLPTLVNTVTITDFEKAQLHQALINKKAKFAAAKTVVNSNEQESPVTSQVEQTSETPKAVELPDFTKMTMEQMKSFIGRAESLDEVEALQFSLNGLFTDGLITSTVMQEGIAQCNQRREYLTPKTNV